MAAGPQAPAGLSETCEWDCAAVELEELPSPGCNILTKQASPRRYAAQNGICGVNQWDGAVPAGMVSDFEVQPGEHLSGEDSFPSGYLMKGEL